MATSGAELVQADGGFAALLDAAQAQARGLDDDGLLSLALPLRGGDPLALLPQLEPAGGDGFRFLWDGAPGLCIAASGRTHSLELSGPRRFELAQRFARLCLGGLAADGQAAGPRQARPRVLLAFGFFDAPHAVRRLKLCMLRVPICRTSA